MSRSTAFRTALVTAVVCLAPLVPVSAAPTAAVAKESRPCRDAPVRQVQTGAVFNDPAAGRATAVVEQVCSLVQQAPAGSRIRIAHFVISGAAGQDLTDELLRARDRGVDVQLVIDGWQVDAPPAAQLLRALGSDRAAGSWAHVCSNLSPEGNTSSCLGSKGQHNKFYLFSRTGGERDVVVQSSANFTDVNSRTYWNNALTVTGNPRLFGAYDGYFEDLAAEREAADDYRSVSTRGGRTPVTAHFFPSADVDPVQQRLDGLDCAADGSTQLRVGMSEWDASRVGLAERLVELAARGCGVRVVHGPTDAEVTDVLDAAGVGRRVLESSALPGRIHSKYLTVEGVPGPAREADFVLTGSHNWNSTSLRRNDEALLDVADARIQQEYAGNFERMWQVGLPA